MLGDNVKRIYMPNKTPQNPKGAGRKTTDRKANKTLSLSVTVIEKLREEKSPSAVINELAKKHYNL